MISDRFAQAEFKATQAQDPLWMDTIRFFRNANDIYSRYDEWKSNDVFYFIPLKLDMSYHICGHTVRMADGPIFLGTFVRNTLEHKELFCVKCPKCGKDIYPFSYNGSPLSGRVDLEAKCDCGWDGSTSVSGWKVRSEALKSAQLQDAERFRSFQKKALSPANIQSLLEELNVL
jgi:hypothetical protein